MFWSLTALLLVLAGGAGAAWAEEVDLRAFGGAGSGVAAEGWVPGGRARLDLEAATLVPGDFDWAGAGAIVPLAGTRRRFFAARAGYALEHLGMDGADWRGSRFAHAVDGGAAFHVEAAGGSAFETQVGIEGVFRGAATSCCDHAALQTSSYGLRLMLRGELGLSPTWALFAEAGLRTADHILEIKILPTLSAGIRVRL
jgi:hypothetical protein